MEYNKITNPYTNRKVNINSRLGKQIINAYIQNAGANVCPITNFVYHLYDSDILFPSDADKKKESCFLRGTFVFEDSEAEVFKMLENKACNKTHSFWKSTHSEARKKDIVDASLRLKRRQNDTEKFKHKKNKDGHLIKFYQYEHKINPSITFLCDKQCRENTIDAQECDESKEDKKRVLFMYHFKTKKIGNILPRRYTLLKLEGHFSISMGHTQAAIDRYILGKEGKTAYKTTRREDCFKKNSCQFKKKDSYSASDDYHVKNFLDTPGLDKQTANEVSESIDFYKNNVRTGDELFIPQHITDKLLDTFNK